MDRGELQKKAAVAIRELVDENDKLKEDQEIYKECIKLAFELADGGLIESDHEAISSKAQDLFDNKDEIDVVKKAMEYNTNYQPVGDLEKQASTSADGGPTPRDMFEEVLKRGY